MSSSMTTSTTTTSSNTVTQNLEEVLKNVYNFVFDAYRYTKEPVLKECLNNFDKIDINIMFPHLSFICESNNSVFEKGEGMDLDVEFLPSINLKEIGKKCTPIQKSKLATRLQMINTLIIIAKNKLLSSTNDDTSFNPYIGVQGGNLDVATITEGPMDLPETLMPKSEGMFNNILGSLNLAELTASLKNFDPEAIRRSMSGFNAVLRKDVDEQTADIITNTVVDMGTVLKTVDLQKEGFQGLIKTMGNKLAENLQNKDIDKNGLKKGMDRMMNSLVGADGKPLFDMSQPMNPFALLSKITTMTPDEQKKMAENCSKSLGIDISEFGKQQQ